MTYLSENLKCKYLGGSDVGKRVVLILSTATLNLCTIKNTLA